MKAGASEVIATSSGAVRQLVVRHVEEQFQIGVAHMGEHELLHRHGGAVERLLRS